MSFSLRKQCKNACFTSLFVFQNTTMSDAIPELVPVAAPTVSAEEAFKQICSMKRLGLTVRQDLLTVIPGAIQFAKERMPIDPLLERACAHAGRGSSVPGSRSIRLALAAVQNGTFASSEVPAQVLVALRDELGAEEASLLEKPTVNSQTHHPEANTKHPSKDLREAFRSIIGTQEDPRCGEAIHTCLTQTGFCTEPWITPNVKRQVCDVAAGRLDWAYYAKALTEIPPGVPFANAKDDGVRLSVWTLLCKLGAIVMSYRLRHEGVSVSRETLESLMRDNSVDTSNKSIVAHLAAHSRAVSQVHHSRPSLNLEGRASARGAPPDLKPRYGFRQTVSSTSGGTCWNCGKRGHQARNCKASQHRDREKPFLPRHGKRGRDE